MKLFIVSGKIFIVLDIIFIVTQYTDLFSHFRLAGFADRDLLGKSVLTNFWRSVENMTIIPLSDSTMVWGVSQAAPLRRVYVKGNLQLFDKGYASGGFLADSKVDGKITSGPQSEMPYDPPAIDAWKHDDVKGYASYKVADNVKNHEAWGLGIYNVFYNAPVIVDNAIETPPALENKIHHIIIYWLNGNKESVVKSIINGKGGSVNESSRKATIP